MAALQLLANGSIFCKREREREKRDRESLFALVVSMHWKLLEPLTILKQSAGHSGEKFKKKKKKNKSLSLPEVQGVDLH